MTTPWIEKVKRVTFSTLTKLQGESRLFEPPKKSKFEESSVKLQCLSGEGLVRLIENEQPWGSRNRDSAVNHTAHFITKLISSSVGMDVGAPSDLAEGGGGGPFCPKKYTMPEFLSFVIGIQKHLYRMKRKNVYHFDA